MPDTRVFVCPLVGPLPRPRHRPCLPGPAGHPWPGAVLRLLFFCKDIVRKVNNKGKVLRDCSVVAMVTSFAANKGALWGYPGVRVLAGG